MITLSIIFATATIALGLARWWRLPTVPVLILSGVVLAVSGIQGDNEQLQQMLLLGLTFLVFFAGTELNPRRLGAQRRAAIQVGVIQFILLGGIGLGVALLIGFDLVSGFYIALALAASSTLVVVRLLQQRAQLFEPLGRLVLGVLLVQDVLVIFFISLLSNLAEGGWGIAIGLAEVAGLMLLSWILIRWLTPYLLLKLSFDEENLLLVVLAILFAFVGLSQIMAVPLVVGAFLAGVSLSAFPVNGLIRAQLLSLSHFFLAVFFVALGASLRMPMGSELILAGILIVLVVGLTPPLVTLIAEKAGLSARAAIESGLLLAQTSEFSIIVALAGLQQNHIGDGILSVIALVTVATMILTPFIATNKIVWRLMKLHPSRWQNRPVSPPSGHVLLIGCGETGRILLEHLIGSGERILVVDDDPAIVNQLRARGIDAIRGDGADYRLLNASGARTARIVISTMRRLKDHESVLKFTKSGRVVARVFEEAEAERIRRRGGIPVLYSHAAAGEFLRWFGQEFAARTTS
ncbi:MAG: cation:proton antiporter [Acidobacteriota bacterium]